MNLQELSALERFIEGFEDEGVAVAEGAMDGHRAAHALAAALLAARDVGAALVALSLMERAMVILEGFNELDEAPSSSHDLLSSFQSDGGPRGRLGEFTSAVLDHALERLVDIFKFATDEIVSFKASSVLYRISVSNDVLSTAKLTKLHLALAQQLIRLNDLPLGGRLYQMNTLALIDRVLKRSKSKLAHLLKTNPKSTFGNIEFVGETIRRIESLVECLQPFDAFLRVATSAGSPFVLNYALSITKRMAKIFGVLGAMKCLDRAPTVRSTTLTLSLSLPQLRSFVFSKVEAMVSEETGDAPMRSNEIRYRVLFQFLALLRALTPLYSEPQVRELCWGALWELTDLMVSLPSESESLRVLKRLFLLTFTNSLSLILFSNDVTLISRIVLSLEHKLYLLKQFESSDGMEGEEARFEVLDSLFFLLEEEDDQLIELLHSLLRITLFLQKNIGNATMEKVVESKVATAFTSILNPHFLFLKFLISVDFDSSLLLDLLISDETNFLEYFTMYLSVIEFDWVDFENSLKAYPKPLDSIDDNATEGEDDKNDMEDGESTVTFSAESASSLLGISYGDIESDTRSAKAFSKSIKLDIEEVDPSAPSSYLDEAMSTLIRLRLSIERAVAKKLFPYKADVLLGRLETVESTYESNAANTASVIGKILL